jgi:hypothetical protein
VTDRGPLFATTLPLLTARLPLAGRGLLCGRLLLAGNDTCRSCQTKRGYLHADGQTNTHDYFLL